MVKISCKDIETIELECEYIYNYMRIYMKGFLGSIYNERSFKFNY